MMAPVVRSSKYVGKHVVEEDIPMPYTSAQPRTDDRRAVHERIKVWALFAYFLRHSCFVRFF